MVRLTVGLQTSVGRSLQGTFRPYRAVWHRRDKDEDPGPYCKVALDRMVNVGQKRGEEGDIGTQYYARPRWIPTPR